MKYQAVIFDLDGTAIPLHANALPSPALVQAVRDTEDTIILCAATGRPITNARPILKALGLIHPCVISAGTEIVDPQTGEILWECDIDPEAVKQIIEICSPYPHELLVRNELMGEGSPAASHAIDGPVNVMYLMQCDQADAEVVLAKLADVPGVTASAVLSWAGEHKIDIHITPAKATKEHAIAELLKIIKVPKDKTVGVGDADNDLHLFKGVGLKVAMGNATKNLKAQADMVCGSIDEDGLAKVILDAAADRL